MSLRATLRADYDHFLRLAGRPEGRALPWMLLNPRTLPVVLIRLVRSLETARLGPLAAVLRLLVLWWFRVEVPGSAQIGPGLVLPHPGGIVIGSARIGRNAVIFQNVTLGARAFDGGFDPDARPTLGDDVTLGAGAVVLGGVAVGDGATVGANSLVLRDVPAGATALGVPASVKPAR